MSVALYTGPGGSGEQNHPPDEKTDLASPQGGGHGRRRSDSRSGVRQWRRAAKSPLFYIAVGIPALVLAGLTALLIVGALISPRHVGPLAPLPLLVIVATIPALVFAAARRVGPKTVGALIAAVLCTGLLLVASSDVVGVPEHLSVVMGLLAVAVWPRHTAGPTRRHAAAVLAGAAIAVSPLAAIAVAAATARLILRANDRRRRARALVGPVITGCLTLLIGLVLLVATGWIVATTWAGTIALATFVVAVAPAIGVAAGLGIDGAIEGIASRETMPQIASVIGAMTITLLLAATAGATISQLRDRAVAVVEGPATGAIDPDDSGMMPSDSDDEVIDADTEESTDVDAGSAEVEDETVADADADRRRSDAAQLLENPNLTLGDSARSLLEEGAVDRRVLLVVGQLLTDRTLTVEDFPDTGDAVRRALLVTAADGDALGTGGASVPLLTAYLSGLSGAYEVESVSVDSDGVLAVFPPAD